MVRPTDHKLILTKRSYVTAIKTSDFLVSILFFDFSSNLFDSDLFAFDMDDDRPPFPDVDRPDRLK